MKLTLRTSLAVLVAGSLFSLFVTSIASAALDDGYPPGDAVPGRTCLADAVGNKTISSFSGKSLSCIMIAGVAKWWIDGDPLPAIETAAPSASSGPVGCLECLRTSPTFLRISKKIRQVA